MVDTLFSFGTEQFNRIFPFYILVDRELEVISFGKSLAKLYPIHEGSLFSDCFQLKLPQIEKISFNTLLELSNQVVLISLNGSNHNILRGQFEYIDATDQLLFIGTPCFTSIDEIKEERLTLNDFAKHDSFIDQLHVLKAQELAAQEVKSLLNSVNEQNGNPNGNDNIWKFALKGDIIWHLDLSLPGGNGLNTTKKSISISNKGGEIDYNSWLELIHPEDKDKVKSQFTEFIDGRLDRFETEHRWKPAGGYFKYFVTRAVITNRTIDGKPSHVIATLTDIDEQKKTEFQLKETANRLFFLIQNLDSGVVVEGKDNKIILVNDKFCKFLGIKETPDQLVGMNYTVATRHSKYLYKYPEDVVTRIYQILDQKKPALHELIELADGRFFKRDYVPIFIDEKYEGHLWQYVDVTEQTLAEHKIEDQKIFYENVLNNIPADIVAFNMNHEYLFVNPTAVKDPEVRKWMIGQTDENYCRARNKPDNIALERTNVFNEVIKNKKLIFWEEKLIDKDGNPEFHLRNMFPVLDENGEVIQVIGFGLDITDRKKIEDQLKINEKRYRDLFNYSQAYICTHDLTGKLITVNPAICELLGQTQEELIGKSLTEFLPHEDISAFQTSYLDKVIHDGSANGIFRIIGDKGRKAFLIYKNFKVQDEISDPYIIGFSQDITERIKTEKELLATKKITEEANRAKETFLANMSHEIRTPMTGILGIANLLSKTGLDDQQRKFTKLISESANNLLTIVNDVLDIEKIAAGKLDLELIPFKLEDKVFTTLQSFQFKAEDKNINLLMNSSLPDDLIVIGDPYRLSQILNNLLSNALKFTNDGEISINMDTKKSDDKTLTVEIQVQDTGIGIRQEKLTDIFNPFVQASSDTTRKYGGTGLGLTICKNLVEMQGGKINVKSAEGVGTTFSFFIPYEKGTEDLLPDDNKEDINFKDLESIRILVAEDVELNQFLVKHILDSWGCEVTIANNGREAVEIVKKQYFDLILMDIQMPEMDGITATKTIRNLNIAEKSIIDKSLITKKIRTISSKDKSTIPIIALTANALKGDGQRYIDIGMNGYITKPYTEEKLFQVINQVIKTNDKLRIKVTNPGKGQSDNTFIPTPAPPPPPPVEKLYDLSLINTIGKDDSAFAKKIITIFLESMPESLDNLVKFAQDKNYEQISKTAHKMKSSIDSMGISSLKDIIRELEATKADNNNSEVLIPKVKSILTDVFAQLKQII